MESGVIIRAGHLDDVTAMARVHVESWRETYRGIMADEILDNPGFIAARERFWTAALVDQRRANNRIAVAELEGSVIGIAMSGPPEDFDAGWSRKLYLIYVLAAAHGSGAGQLLLNAVIEPHESAVLWVADPNPRAQAFYRRNGFLPDGSSKVEDEVKEIRMGREAPGTFPPSTLF
jgi:ribosomal protein S18 acetylase RimI-like enzyme